MGRTDLIKNDIKLTGLNPFKESYERILPYLHDEVRAYLKEMS